MSVEGVKRPSENFVRLSSLLLSEEKRKRKAALEDIHKELFENEVCVVSKEDLDEVYGQLQKNLLKCMNDSSEVCREITVSLITGIISSLPVHEKYLIVLIPHLVQRLGGQEIIEPSEEVRLSLVSLLGVIIKKYGSLLQPYLNEIVQIFSKTLLDPFPMVKRESCECLSDFAVALSKHFHMQSDTVIKPLLKVITHQHFKVRVAGIKALGNAILYGNNKSIDCVVGPLAERLFDQNVPVRLEVAKIVGRWFIDYPDRYSFFHKFLPILLTCLMDEIPEIRLASLELWEKAGMQYETENENELKDLKDFITTPPEHYPPNIDRPNLGCRALVKNNLGKILPALVKELGDWTAEIRLKSACLLYQLILHAESAMTIHLDKILNGLYGAASDEEDGIKMQVEKSAELIGYFVPPKTYCGLILPVLECSPTSGHLFIFSAILRGSEKDQLLEELQNIGQLLSDNKICHSMKSDYQMQLLKCCESIIFVCHDRCLLASSHLFRILISVFGLSSEKIISHKSELLIDKLRDLENMPSEEEFYSKFMGPLLTDLQITAANWSIYSPERFVLEALLNKSGAAIGLHWEDISQIIISASKPGNDPEVKIKLLTLVSNILNRNNNAFNLLPHPPLLIFVQEALHPNLEWHAGRTASATRTTALSCLYSCLTFEESLSSDLLSAGEKYLLTLLSLVEDESPLTRKLVLHCLCKIFENSSQKMNVDGINKASEVIIKRLDDVNDGVRMSSIRAITLLFSKLPPDYDIVCFKPYILSVYTTALIHLDDPDEKFNVLVLEMLKKIGKMLPQELRDKVAESKNKFRNATGCEDLLKHLENILLSD